MTIITPNSISGISSITAQSGTLEFYNASGSIMSVTGNVTGNVNSTGVSTFATLRATSLVGVTTAGITTAYISSINDGPLAGARNRIINGDMRIDQRNAGASVTPGDGQYTLDRWVAYRTQASRFSVQQNAGSVTPPAGFTNYLGCTSLSAYSPISTDYFGIVHFIEGFNSADLAWGTASAQAITISFWSRSSLTGTFPVAVRNNVGDRGYLTTYSVSAANTWEFKSVVIPGDVSGTWLTNNGIGIRLWFDLGSGSTTSGTAGVWGSASPVRTSGSVSIVATNGATFYITGVQLEPGTVATPFERRSYGQELALCRRYYKKGLAVGGNSNASFFWSYFGGSLGVRDEDIDMASFRTSPNLSLLNNTNVQYYSYAGAWTNTTLTISTLGISVWPNTRMYLYITADGDGRGKLVRCTNASTDVQWVADAEL